MSLERPYRDIPGTIIFDADMARRGYHLNQFFMSLKDVENRKCFLADEETYLDKWNISSEQKQAVLDRDYNWILKLGGNIYFFAKLFSTDGDSFEQAASAMTGISREEYRQMMLDGGRTPEGNLCVQEERNG